MRQGSNADLQRLVKERAEGALSRRDFLARLGRRRRRARRARRGRAPAGAQKKVVVTMWDTEPNPATRAAMKAIVEDFQKLHKDIEVRAEGMGWGDMDRKLQAAMAAKSPPTASHTQTYVVTSFRAKGLIEPVDDVVKAIGEDKIFPSVLQWLKYPDGKYWGITHAWGAEILGGRGDYAQAAGRRPAELEDLGRLAPRPAEAQQGAAALRPRARRHPVLRERGRLHVDGRPTAGASSTPRATRRWRARRCSGCSSSGRSSSRTCRRAGPRTTTWRRCPRGRRARRHRCMMWGRTAGYIDQYAPPDKRNPDVFQVWPKTIGPDGQGAAHPVRQRAVGDLRRRARRREGGVPRVPQVLLQARELPQVLRLGARAHPARSSRPTSRTPRYTEPPRAQALEAVARRAGQVGGDRDGRTRCSSAIPRTC